MRNTDSEKSQSQPWLGLSPGRKPWQGKGQGSCGANHSSCLHRTGCGHLAIPRSFFLGISRVDCSYSTVALSKTWWLMYLSTCSTPSPASGLTSVWLTPTRFGIPAFLLQEVWAVDQHISIAWDLAKNAESQAPPLAHWIRNWFLLLFVCF